MANSPQTGLVESKNAELGSNFLQGIMKANAANLGLMSPFQSGRHYFVFTRMCDFMAHVFPDKTKTFKCIVERFSTAFDGIQDMQAQFGDVNGGTSANKFSYLTVVEDNFDEFTVRVPYDTNTLVLMEYLDLWLSGTQDPASGFTHYHGAIKDGTFEPSLQHEVAEGLYVLTDRAGRPIRSAMVYGIFPTKSHRSQLNSEKGSYDAQQVDLTFKGIKRESAAINRTAVEFIKALDISYNYLDEPAYE